MDNAWGLLPLVALGALVLAGRAAGQAWLQATLRAVPVWAVFVWTMSNILSFPGLLRPGSIKAVWLAGSLITAGYAVFKIRSTTTRLRTSFRLAGAFEWMVLVGILALGGLALVTALAAPPLTVDVLSYHAPRQLFWLQQGSLAHFTTINDRQLMMPPLAEIIGLQFLALTGDDYWANLPQWFAYGLTPCAAISILRTLGVSRGATALAAWLVVCLPMAYLEAANGKNDLLGELWLLLLLAEVAAARKAASPPDWRVSARAGSLLALAVLTKSTALVFAPPLLLAGGWAWGRHGGKPAGRAVALAALVAMLVMAPFFFRNLAWYGTPLGIHRAVDGGQQTNTAITPAIIASNAVRNAALHVALPFPRWNQGVIHLVLLAHRWLGLSVNDPRSTLWGVEFTVPYSPRAETLAGAPGHFFMMGGAVLLTCFWRPARDWRWLALVIAAMALGYCVVVKWQTWGNRLQLPVFAVGALLAGGVTGCLPARLRTPATAGIALLTLLAWWPGREAKMRPLWTSPTLFELDRETNAYRYWPALQARDAGLVTLLRTAGVKRVMVVSLHDITYRLMRKLQREIPGMHFHGAPVSDERHDPEAIVALEFFRPRALYHRLPSGARYRLVSGSSGDGVYLPEGQVHALKWENRLPAFAGWTDLAALPLRVDDSSNPPVVWREMPAGRAELFFLAWGQTMHLTGSIVKASRQPESLEFKVNGQGAGRLELSARAGAIGFSFSMPVVVGPNRLELIRPAGAGGTLAFTRLTLNDFDPAANDSPPPPEPADAPPPGKPTVERNLH